MKADYDSEANAIQIDIADCERWDDERQGDGDDRCHVAFAVGRPVSVELLYPDLGVEGPLTAAAERFELDSEALIAAARAALAAPDRVVRLDVSARVAA